ncbi:MAG TPA: 2-oxoglutarate dehydrogenase complex dihydrolipoyllysine-residue succinyltransferase [Thermomicrobiales bacterium]|nr:2-oxoglutarate dehydrogenase complex dihydrolipoyllysine-residue succinyltransferase [Thermomicrobiales bacterium]
MAIEIKVPPLGESLVDAVVGQWLKTEGEEISRGETILELETDKVNLDVTAEDDGILGSIQKQEGDTVTVGEVLGLIEAGGNGAAKTAPAEAPSEPEKTPEPAESPAPAASAPAPAATAEAPASQPSGAEDGAGRAAPAVRRMAEEHDIDLSQVKGSGAGGRITRDDLVVHLATRGGQVPAAAPQPAPTPSQPQPAPQAAALAPAGGTRSDEERVRLSRRRQTIAARLVEAQQTAAMLTTFNEIDMSAVMELRKRRKDAFKEQYGVNLGFMSFFTKAAIGALKAFPEVNSELDGNELILKRHYDIGIAVGVEEGLVVPVVRDADRKSFAEIERTIVELATKARENKLAISDLQGGTFTITNGGVFGSLLSTPILNTPQVGILGMHTIQQRPVAIDGEVVIRPMMYVALSYDHRIVDGQQAVQFLVKIKKLIEDPETLLLEG